MLLEFASNSYYLIHDMQQASVGFFRSLRPDDYVAVITYDLRTHILTDFTNNKEQIAQSLQTLVIPGFSDTNLFDALYETLDRTSVIDGRKYIILIGSGRDTFSKLTLDKIPCQDQGHPQRHHLFAIGTGGFAQEMDRGGSMHRMDVLQAQEPAQNLRPDDWRHVLRSHLPGLASRTSSTRSINPSATSTSSPTAPLNNKNDGTFRHVQVLLVDNEGKPLKMQDEKQKPLKYSIIARDGYRAKLPVE